MSTTWDDMVRTQKGASSMGRRVRRTFSGGFTFIELMLVIIIIGSLAAMVVPRFVGRTKQAKLARAKMDIAQIGTALDLYELDMEGYPEQLPALLASPEGSGATGESRWRGPYLKRGPEGLLDPWGNRYVYERLEGARDYKIISYGPDGKPGNDDITNAD